MNNHPFQFFEKLTGNLILLCKFVPISYTMFFFFKLIQTNYRERERKKSTQEIRQNSDSSIQNIFKMMRYNNKCERTQTHLRASARCAIRNKHAHTHERTHSEANGAMYSHFAMHVLLHMWLCVYFEKKKIHETFNRRNINIKIAHSALECGAVCVLLSCTD